MENSQDSCKELKKCLCCGNEELQVALDLGKQPLANSYLKEPNEEELTFPLALNYCNRCTHLQLSHAVDPNLLFKNYLYVSGTTKTLQNYFIDFVKIVDQWMRRSSLDVLDIACNDGSQLDAFKQFGHNTFGIDPAENLYEISKDKHTIVCDYLTKESIAKFNQKFDVITAQNVFAHNTYPKEFLEICKDNLKDDGRIFIQTSQANMVRLGQFDTVYHEHISFFSQQSMKAVVEAAGLCLQDAFHTDIHGTSYVFVIGKSNALKAPTIETPVTISMIEKFEKSAYRTIEDLKEKLASRKDQLIVGYGAAAKGNTVLNFGQIKFDYIVDDNPLKQGLYTPGMRIPIVSLDHINTLQKDVIWVPLSWNFFKEIKQKIEQYRNNSNDSFVQLNFTQL
jgi:2-polyprenyl-3-methyl-5-hydroxy-6-metoxy-1,4-benzoquinol methylase